MISLKTTKSIFKTKKIDTLHQSINLDSNRNNSSLYPQNIHQQVYEDTHVEEMIVHKGTVTPKAKLLTFPIFEDIKVSTKTFIVMTNMTINIDKLFNFLPITKYILIPTRRGRKTKNEKVD